jgi:hypothetical protein
MEQSVHEQSVHERFIYVVIASTDDILDDFPIYGMYYFDNRLKAINCAVLCTGIRYNLKQLSEIYSDIYRVPLGTDISMGEEFIDLKRYYSHYWIKRVRPRITVAIETIQARFRAYLKKRLDAVVFLQFALRKAIANPYTQLCRKRLMREFNELIEFF